MKLAYLCTPYSDFNSHVKDARYDTACLYAYQLHLLGYAVFSPVIQGTPIAKRFEVKDDWVTWEITCKTFMKPADVIFVALEDGWDTSVGVNGEMEFANDLGRKVKYCKWDAEKNKMFIYSTATEVESTDLFNELAGY